MHILWCHLWVVVAMCRLESATAADTRHRLPTELKPLHYDIRIALDLNPRNNFTFFGVVHVKFKVLKTTAKIVMHAQGYEIENNRIELLGGPDDGAPRKEILNVRYDVVGSDFLTITTSEPLDVQHNYTVVVPFYGNLHQGRDGVFYKSYHDRGTNKTEYIITTYFEPMGARKAFPCFDEPSFKAVFTISLGHNKDCSAISNMRASANTTTNLIESHWQWGNIGRTFKLERSDYIWDQFEPSVPMSTYLVAFAVTKFAFKEIVLDLNIAFRIWARKDVVKQVEYASDVAPIIFKELEKLYRVPYPLPKMDLVAVPGVNFGGIENWGLIIFCEQQFIYNKKDSDFIAKKNIFQLIVHELSHQWFGNLVTMEWWSELWLNEGMTRFFENLVTDIIKPEWKCDETNVPLSMLFVLNLESSVHCHPLLIKTDDPKKNKQIFNAVTYFKGSFITRMIYMFLGKNTFWEAIHNYLVKYSYRNAVSDYLWSELTTSARKYKTLGANVTVKEIMDTWIRQPGFPLLTFRRVYLHDNGSATVTQKRYLSQGGRYTRNESWWIPLSILYQGERQENNTSTLQWLSPKDGVMKEKMIYHAAAFQNDRWVIVNNNMLAPLSVNYDEHNWDLLIKTLDSDSYDTIPTVNRAQLISDILRFVFSNDIDFRTALKLGTYLQRETEYAPFQSAIDSLKRFDIMLRSTNDYGVFQRYVREIIRPGYERMVTFNPSAQRSDDIVNGLIQNLLRDAACHYKVRACEEKALALYHQWMKNPSPDTNNPIETSVRGVVYSVGVYRGSVLEWEFLEARVGSASSVARPHLLAALATSRDLWLLKRLLERIVSNDLTVDISEMDAIVAKILDNTIGYSVFKDFIMNRSEEVEKRFSTAYLQKLLSLVTERICIESELKEFLVWKEKNMKHEYVSSSISLEASLEQATLNVNWLKDYQKSFIRDLNLINADFKTLPSETGAGDLIERRINLANSIRNYNVLLILLSQFWGFNNYLYIQF